MYCLKCGREIKDSQVFCDECLAGMAEYPVKPNITVQIPVRPESPPPKKRSRRKKYVRPEDLIRHLRVKVRCLALVLAVTLAAFLVIAAMLLDLLRDGKDGFGIGQNYDTEAPSDASSEITEPSETSAPFETEFMPIFTE